VHFEAPPAANLPAQCAAFFDWFEAPTVGDALIKAGLAHLWLVTLHPFDDGNGRLSRVLTTLLLLQTSQISRFGRKLPNFALLHFLFR
jgi:Fic family protein